MNAASILWALCTFIASSSNWAQANDECVVVAPNALRLGSRETVVAIVSGRSQTVNIMLYGNRPGRGPIFQTSMDVTQDSPGIAEVLVQSSDVPDVQLTAEYSMVTLSVKCGAWSRNVMLPLSGASADHLFLQTDKPIYQPGSTVNIRFIALNGTLEPSSTTFRLEVRNPQNVILEAKDFNPQQDVMLTHQFNVPKHTLLGEWSLVMRYGHKFEQNTTTTFAVEKYVLPRFSVKIRTPKYILPDFATIRVDVRSKFVNQRLVHGFVSFHFSVKNELGVLEEIGTSKHPKQLVAGDSTYELSRADVVARLGEGKLAALFRTRGRLVVEATVTEEATAIQETGRNEEAVFSSSPYLISTARSEKSFKPGIKFYIVAEVTYPNGEPAAGVQTKLTSGNGLVQPMSYKTNINGVVTFLIPSKSGDGELKFTVETTDPKLQQDQQAKVIVTVQPYNDYSWRYIAIERKDPKALVKARTTYEVSIIKSGNSYLTAYYVVLSRGRVMAAGKVNTDGGVLDPKVAFEVTPEMTPSFRLVVVGFMDKYLVSDSIYVTAVPECTADSAFTLTRKSANPEVVLEPGATETLLLKGRPGTHVGLLGVDQAVYLLRRKDLLTRDKVFQSMEAKDRGNGQDAGIRALETLANSGVVLLASSAIYGAPAEMRQRTKREVKLDIVNEYQNETLRDCCSQGMKPDPYLRSCSEREEALRSYLDDGSASYSETCVEAFVRCCTYVEEHQAVARSFYEQDDLLGEGNFNDLQGLERRDFRETWIFTKVIIEESGEAIYEVTVPDSITTWEVNAVSVAPSGGICVVDPLEIPVFKKLFVEVNLPYSVIQNEQVDIPATVYNYGNEERQVRMAMLGTKDVCSGAKEGRPSLVHKLSVPAGKGRTVVFPVVPLSVGEKEIHVAALSAGGLTDSVKVMLRVEPPGLRSNDSFNVILDPRNTQKRKGRDIENSKLSYTENFALGGTQIIQIKRHDQPPEDVVPGSERCHIDIIGDNMGAALEASVKNPGTLVSMPSGCGEQTMIYLAPTLYAYEYLKTVGRISPAAEERALGCIRSGYQRILTYRKADGSFTVWPGYKSSLWLTAYVVRSLCEAQKSIVIDENVITSGLRYILTQQQQNGCFHDIYSLHHGDLMGGVNGPVPLTAYTFLTLQECASEGMKVVNLAESTKKAKTFIETQLKPDTSGYELSLAAYAVSFSESPSNNTALRRLLNILQRGQDGGLYVPASSKPLSVQATSYALLALLNGGESKDNITAMVQWLNLQMNPSGSLRSSQDTVVALKALSTYSIYARDAGIDLTCEVTLSGDRNFNRTLRIKRENAQQRTRIQLPDSTDKVFIKVVGTGTATMYFVTSYDRPVSANLLCKFHLNITFTQHKVDIQKGQRPMNFKESSMRVCARSLENTKGMAILDVGLLTGFKPVLADLEEMVTNKRVDSFEHGKRSVVFYLQQIPTDADVCVEFRLKQEFSVGKLQSASVKAYAYYDPDISCTKFYSPDRSSALLKIECDDANEGQSDVCRCLEGGCPPQDIKEMFTKENGEVMKTPICRENFRTHACEKAEFVWLGTALSESHKDGFTTIKFFISNVLKPGFESEEDLLNKTRIIKARENCESFEMKRGSQYVIMSMDAKYKEKDRFGDEQYVYMIDSESVVISMESTNANIKKQRGKNRVKISPEKEPCNFDRLVIWFVDKFSDESERCFT